jgi:hypothetical protein
LGGEADFSAALLTKSVSRFGRDDGGEKRTGGSKSKGGLILQ